MSGALLQTPLHGRHLDAGARMAPFAGFDMPVSYASIIEEHRAVRTSAGLFDVSHMGQVRLKGRDAPVLAQGLLSNDALDLPTGRVRYGLLCADDGGVVDDVTLYRVATDEFLFCVNAANIAADVAWIEEVHRRQGTQCELRDESEETALLAIQGPAALDIVGQLTTGDATPPRRWRFAAREVAGVPVWASRTGYTGEDGYELYTPAAHAERLWDRLLDAGGERVRPAGLGARDTLRTEMGYPLYGHELDRSTNPFEAGLERFVRLDRDFVGRAALAEVERTGASRRLVGLWVEGRQVARSGFAIHTPRGVGEVTSGTFGPSVERSIAMGYVPAAAALAGRMVDVEVRGRRVPCSVTDLPFYRGRS